MKKHSGNLCSQGCISHAQALPLARFMTLQRRHHKLSRDTKIVKNRHQEPCQPCVGKSTKVRKSCWISDAFSHLEDHLCVQSFPNSVGLQVRNFKKEGNFSCDVQLLVHWQHLWFDRNPRRKNIEKLLRHPYFREPQLFRPSSNLCELDIVGK